MMAESSRDSGTLYGLGVGPGDPELLTVKALRVLEHVPVVAYVAPDGGSSLARSIVARHLKGGQVEIAFAVPMKTDPGPAREAYEKSVAEIAGHLRDGCDVAVLCQGDPFFYGSFMYLFERLAGVHPVEVVPGVTSLTAAAALAGMPLVSRQEVLCVVPATLSEEALEARLAIPEVAAVVKVGRHLAKVRRVLQRLGRSQRARYVERAGMDGERVLALDDAGDGTAPYFSIVLVGAEAAKR